MKYEQIDIDPGFARALLDASTEIAQRAIIQRRVSMFAADMAAGQWRLTHQAIAIDPDGQVIDGQHRLSAVIQSGATVPMMVAYDADPDTFGSIDTGKARTPGDALRILGVGNANIKASMARLLLTYDRVRGSRYSFGATSRLVTSADIQAVFTSDRRDQIAAAEPVASRIAHSVARHGVRTWMGAAYVIASESEVGESAVAEFFERVNDGAMLPPSSPILALRRNLINDTGIMAAPAASRPGLTIAITIKALNDYTHGRSRTNMLFREGREDFPEVLKPDPRILELAAEERERLWDTQAKIRSAARKRTGVGKGRVAV